MSTENWLEIDRRHFEEIGSQIALIQALFCLVESLDVKQLIFRKLFRVYFLLTV